MQSNIDRVRQRLEGWRPRRPLVDGEDAVIPVLPDNIHYCSNNTHHAVLSSKMNQYLQFRGALIVNIYELGCKMTPNSEKALNQVQYNALN